MIANYAARNAEKCNHKPGLNPSSNELMVRDRCLVVFGKGCTALSVVCERRWNSLEWFGVYSCAQDHALTQS